jgi:hypothetical protein
METVTGATARMSLIAIIHPGSLAQGPPSTTPSPPATLLGERLCCARSRSPAAKAPRDTALKPDFKWFCCVKLAEIIPPRLRSRICQSRDFII